MTQTAEQRRLIRLAAAMNAKAVREGAKGRVTAEELAGVILASDGVCAYCGDEIPLMEGSFDHVVPYSRGGVNLPSNLVRSCLTCNRTKHTKSPDELMEWLRLRVTCVVDGTVFRPKRSA